MLKLNITKIIVILSAGVVLALIFLFKNYSSDRVPVSPSQSYMPKSVVDSVSSQDGEKKKEVAGERPNITIENPPVAFQRSFRIVSIDGSTLKVRPRRTGGSVILQNNRGDEYTYKFVEDLVLKTTKADLGGVVSEIGGGERGHSLFLVSQGFNQKASLILLKDGDKLPSHLKVKFSSEPLAWVKIRSGKLLDFLDLGYGKMRFFYSATDDKKYSYVTSGKRNGVINLTGLAPEWAWIVYVKLKIEVQGPLLQPGKIFLTVDEEGQKVFDEVSIPTFSGDVYKTDIKLEVPIIKGLAKSLNYHLSSSLAHGNVGMLGLIEGYYSSRSQGN